MDEQKIRTMEEFAAASGVSRPTVSKYFDDPESVRRSTRQRIEAAIERYDYRPNIYAMNQNRRSTKMVGIVVPYLADPFFAEIARRVERSCIAAGLRPLTLGSHGDPTIEIENLAVLHSLKPAGVLLAPLGHTSDKAEIEAFCNNVPTVLFDSDIEGLGEAFVGSDNVSFVAQSVDYLSRTGEPPCLFEMRTPANPNANERRAAYVDVMGRHGLEPRIVKIDGEGWAFEEIGYRGGLRVLEEGSLPTSTVLCSNDRLAIGFLAACYERGLRVGRGDGCALRVASHDDHPFSRYTCPSLTTVGHDYDEVAGQSVRTLLEVIEQGGQFVRRTKMLIPARFVLRSSA